MGKLISVEVFNYEKLAVRVKRLRPSKLVLISKTCK